MMTADTQSDPCVKEAPQLVHCKRCDMPLAPRQEIERALALLRQAGMSEAVAEERHSLLHICSSCKCNQSARSMRNVKVALFLQNAKGK